DVCSSDLDAGQDPTQIVQASGRVHEAIRTGAADAASGSQIDAQPGDELLRVEREASVVPSAGVEDLEAIAAATGAGSGDENRGGGPEQLLLAKLSTELDARGVAERRMEDHDVRVVHLDLLEDLGARGGADHGKAIRRQDGFQRPDPDFLFVGHKGSCWPLAFRNCTAGEAILLLHVVGGSGGLFAWA